MDCNETNTADLVAQHTAGRDEELQKVLKQIEELTSTVTEKEARCNKLVGVVAELKIKERELEINVTELSKKNAELERIEC